MDAVTPAELRGRRVLVLGLGAFGGGAGCARALTRLGAEVTVTDLRDADVLADSVAALEGYPVRFALGGHDEAMFTDAEVVVVNPAVPNEARWLQVARDAGCKLTTEVNLALAACAQTPAFAVTGTHGKSTCAAFAAHLMEGLSGRTVLAGNLGGSLLEQTAELGADDRLIVELSSFQTERLLAPAGWPRVAALTCLGSDHLDRHHSVEEYWAAKQRLLAFQDESCVVLLPPPHWGENARGEVRWLDVDALECFDMMAADLPAPEPYLLPSYAAALHAASLFGVAPEELRARSRNFPGLPHRMQEIAGPPGVRVLDNGVATHPEPTEAALRHTMGPTVLLLGGKDKGLPLDALAEAAGDCVASMPTGRAGSGLPNAVPSAESGCGYTTEFGPQRRNR